MSDINNSPAVCASHDERSAVGAIEYGAKSLPLDEQGHCPSLQERERVQAEISAEVREILSDAVSAVQDGGG